MTLHPKSLAEIQRVVDALHLKTQAAIAAHDYNMYQKYYYMRAGLTWSLGYSESDLDVL